MCVCVGGEEVDEYTKCVRLRESESMLPQKNFEILEPLRVILRLFAAI